MQRHATPRDSPGFKAFEHQLGRVGGGATLIDRSRLLGGDSFGRLAMTGELACLFGALAFLPSLLHVTSTGGGEHENT